MTQSNTDRHMNFYLSHLCRSSADAKDRIPLPCSREHLFGSIEGKTQNGILSTLGPRRDTLRRAVALDASKNRILAQPEPAVYFPIRLAFSDEC